MAAKRRIVFFHPDLGIGGAERLVVDAAVGLQERGHKIVIFTSHCDPGHCFDEARDGTLDVRVRGNAVVPATFLGRFAILCAVLRQLHLVLQIAVLSSELQDLQADVFFVDQLSACVPLLRLLVPAAKVLFYCHFPDKLLAKKGGYWKDVYRVPFDWLEQWTTGTSDRILVNSKFTRSIFASAFPALQHRIPHVVYPCVDVEPSKGKVNGATQEEEVEPLWKDKKVILSINRFERKKDVGLAIRAFAGLAKDARRNVRLVIAGGYDSRVVENVSYHKELEGLTGSLGMQSATTRNLVTAMSVPSEIEVLFLLSIPSSLKSTLLRTSSLLVYTPEFEHFGIVPLEAMLAGIPVLAANRGGPTETIVDGQCGWLRDASQVEEWTKVMKMVINSISTEDLTAMGQHGRQRAIAHFSQQKMALTLDNEINGLLEEQGRPSMSPGTGVFLGLSALVLVVGLVVPVIVAFSWKS